MGHDEHLLDVQRSDADSQDSHPRPASELRIEDVRELTIRSLPQLEEIRRRYVQLPEPKMNPVLFDACLRMRRDCWFVEIGGLGLAFLSDIVPKGNAVFHLVFWDGKYKRTRDEAIRSFLVTAFGLFELKRVTTYVPHSCFALRSVLRRRIGFVLEGCMRQAWYDVNSGQFLDTLIFGLLQEEATWPSVGVTLTSLV